jgi:hypothetical protein
MAFDQFIHIFFFHEAIKNFTGVDHDNGAHFAKTETACFKHLDSVLQIPGFKLFNHFLD